MEQKMIQNKLNSYDYRIKQDGKEDSRTKKYIFELL
jgi:hypothetical protein